MLSCPITSKLPRNATAARTASQCPLQRGSARREIQFRYTQMGKPLRDNVQVLLLIERMERKAEAKKLN